MGGLVLGRWEGAVRFGRGVQGGVPAPPNTFFMFFRNVNASFVVCSINDFKSDQTNRPNGFPTITLCDQAISKIAMTARGVTSIRPKRTTCEGLHGLTKCGLHGLTTHINYPLMTLCMSSHLAAQDSASDTGPLLVSH